MLHSYVQNIFRYTSCGNVFIKYYLTTPLIFNLFSSSRLLLTNHISRFISKNDIQDLLQTDYRFM